MTKRKSFLTVALCPLLVCLYFIGCVAEESDMQAVSESEDAALGSDGQPSTPSAIDADMVASDPNDQGSATDMDAATLADRSVMPAQEAPDVQVADAASVVDAAPRLPIMPCDLNVQLNQPENLSFHPIDSPPTLEGAIFNTANEPVPNLTVQLMNQDGDIFALPETDENGAFSASAAPLFSTSGFHLVRAMPRFGDGLCAEFAQVGLYSCGATVAEDFSMLPESWTLFGDATWNSGGWLEMTGIEMGRAGAVYNTVEVISSGMASIQFTLTTGGGINGGADGFAFTIVEVQDADTLLALLNAANAGGGLGYAVGGSHADEDFTLTGDAITVEIDTFYNSGGNRHTDPTSQNHIAITQNADPGDHLVWFPVPSIEDLQPHTVRVDILDGLMRIAFDGNIVIEEEVSIAFKGGYMFFSGSTGWASNFHRFDDLRILHNCR